jgi:hypothetical protein
MLVDQPTLRDANHPADRPIRYPSRRPGVESDEDGVLDCVLRIGEGFASP